MPRLNKNFIHYPSVKIFAIDPVAQKPYLVSFKGDTTVYKAVEWNDVPLFIEKKFKEYISRRKT